MIIHSLLRSAKLISEILGEKWTLNRSSRARQKLTSEHGNVHEEARPFVPSGPSLVLHADSTAVSWEGLCRRRHSAPRPINASPLNLEILCNSYRAG